MENLETRRSPFEFLWVFTDSVSVLMTKISHTRWPQPLLPSLTRPRCARHCWRQQPMDKAQGGQRLVVSSCGFQFGLDVSASA